MPRTPNATAPEPIARLRRNAPTERFGLPSYAAGGGTGDPTGVDEAVAAAVEGGGIRAARAALASVDGGERRLAELRSTGGESWVHLVDAPLSGPCLDASAGFGTRAHLLAERGAWVCALDADAHRLRAVAARDDFDSGGRVVSIHGDPDAVPLPRDAFRTVVADGRVRAGFDGDLRAAVDALRRPLASGGTMVLALDGWPRRAGVSGLLWSDERAGRIGLRSARDRTLRSTAAAYRSLLSDAGFERIDLYALLPSRHETEFVFDVADRAAVERFLSEHVHTASVRRLVAAADRAGLLEQAYPSYLAVCSSGADGDGDGGGDAADDGRGTLLRAGYNRSVAFDVADGELVRVRKLPNAASRAATTERESAVLRTIEGVDGPVAAALPTGDVRSTPAGPVRSEAPVEGTPLVDALGEDAASFGAALEVALSWLASLQTALRGDRTVRSPAAVVEDLTAPVADLALPRAPDAPVDLFRAPVHGDYHLWNVYVDDGRVSAVIDWEFAAVDGLPVADVGTLLQYAWTNALGSHEAGFEAVVARDTPHAAAARRALGAYCGAVGLEPRALGAYLTYGLARALRFADENPELHSPWAGKFVRWANRVRERDAAVRSFFGSI